VQLFRKISSRKGDVLRQIPLSPRLLDLLGDYLEHRRLDRDLKKCPPDTQLIPALEDNRDKATRKAAELTLGADACASTSGAARPPKERPVDPEKLYDAVRRFFANAASAAALQSPELGAALGKASTHWLRHTFGSHAVAKGMALETARNLLGHASLATTSIYSTAEIALQYREVDEFLADSI
jgi:integrase